MRRFLQKIKLKETLIIFSIATALAILVWQVFYQQDEETVKVFNGNQTEEQLALLLNEINGVGDVDVMIHETEEGVQSVVVVCEGAENLLVNMHVREAVAAALGADEKSVKIYLKK